LVQRLSAKFDVMTTVRREADVLISRDLARPDQIISNVDLLNDQDLMNAIELAEPDVIINAVGVIKQLPTSDDVINTLMVNSILPHKLAEIGKRFDYKLIVVSTDCVFKGDRGNYNESDAADALDLYGRSKNLGEVSGPKCLTIRTSIIGRELATRHSLVEWFLSNRDGKVSGFNKAIYSGFPTMVFADIIGDLLTLHPDLNGIWHVSSEPIDKFMLLTMINEKYKAGVQIEPDDSFVIDRSLDSSRFRAATGFSPKPWPEMIEAMAADPTPYDDRKR
jgi:dTDP-4-dehydrorhamnose reductase